MSAVKEVFSILAAKAEEAIPVHNCDYTDKATGLLVCGKCRSPKQCRPFSDSDFAVYCLCDCMKADDAAMRERLRQNQIEQRRTICFGSSDLIDGRLRSGKPCVITTNLTMNDFAAPKDLMQKRIVSRMFERVTTFQVKGEDRRFAALKERAVPASIDLKLSGSVSEVTAHN